MSLSEILIPLSGAECDADALAFGAAQADRLGGQAVAVLAQADPGEALSWSAEGVYAALPETVIESAREGADTAWRRAEARIAAYPTILAERLVGNPEASLAQRAALADLAVFSCPTVRGRTVLAGGFEALLLGARLPVLVARGDPAALAGPALIAWDGGAEAARAVKGALPLLAKASEVVIVQAPAPLEEEGRRFAEPERLAANLARRGLSAEVQILAESGGGHQIAGLVLEAAQGRGAGLIVAGAYGHSRLREFIFGGATRRFLNATSGPALLLSH